MPDPVIYQNPLTGTRWTATGDNVALLLSWGWEPVADDAGTLAISLDETLANAISNVASETRDAVDDIVNALFTAPADVVIAGMIDNEASATAGALRAALGLGVQATDVGYDVILLAGQSNMSGRATADTTHFEVPDARVWQYGAAGTYASVISAALEPLAHADTVDLSNGLGPGGIFARWYAMTLPANRRVLVVPAAYGGTGFSSSAPNTWDPAAGAGSLYLRAIAQANAAIAAAGSNARLAAILWHQGEQDVAMSASAYQAKLDALIDGFRSQITGATTSTPFVIGSLAPEFIASTSGAPAIDGVHRNTPPRKVYTAFAVGTAGYVSDGTHYNAVGQRLLGRSYFDALSVARTNTAPGTVPVAPAPPIAISDSFTRSDSASSLGGSWGTPTGTWGIRSNTAYLATAATTSPPWNVAPNPVGVSDGTASLDITGSSIDVGALGMAVRISDPSNYIGFRLGGGVVQAYRIVAGGVNSLGDFAFPHASSGTVTLSVVMTGSTLVVKANGTTVTTLTETFNQSASSHGLWGLTTDANSSADNFSYTS